MKDSKTIYIFIGPPGSGKGTLAQECVKQLGFATLSTGALCREHISQQTEIGKNIDFIIKSGKLISDSLVTAMVDDWLARHVGGYGALVIDGYPRTDRQVRDFVNLVRAKYAGAVVRIVKFDISDEAVVARLSRRLVCQGCQAIYSTAPATECAPKKTGFCDVCGKMLVQRTDDTPEVIKNRLAIYHEHDPSPVFVELGYLVETIDADRRLEEVFDDFRRLVVHGSTR